MLSIDLVVNGGNIVTRVWLMIGTSLMIMKDKISEYRSREVKVIQKNNPEEELQGLI